MKHGHARRRHLSKEYRAWRGMRRRCLDETSSNYAFYGGRGITIHPSWNSFKTFLRDVGPAPSEEHQLDRHPDQNGNYGPGNVRWATKLEQANNTRSNRQLEFSGETHTMAEWGRITSLGQHLIEQRLNCLGWSVKDALTKPSGQKTASRGEDRYNAVVTEEIVRYIRKNYAARLPGRDTKEMAKKFGISISTVKAILSGRAWKHVKVD